MTQDRCTRNQKTFHPKLATTQRVCKKDKKMNEQQKELYDQQHREHIESLAEFSGTPHSCVVEVPLGQVRRNQTALISSRRDHPITANTA